MMEVKVVERKFSELKSLGRFADYEDPDRGLIDAESVADVFVSDPYLTDTERTAQILGVVENRIIGRISPFPLHVIADGALYEGAAGMNLSVNPNFRKTGFAIDLIERLDAYSKDQIQVGYYVSRVARKMIGMMGDAVFSIRQFALVKRSAYLLGKRLPKWGRKIFCPVLDLIFFIHYAILRLVVGLKTRGWKIEQVRSDDVHGIGQFVDMVKSDRFRFRQSVDADFVQWALRHDFETAGNWEKSLYRVSIGGKAVGFFLSRATLGDDRGRLLDWQTEQGWERIVPWMLLKGALIQRHKVLATVISVSATDSAVVKVLKWLLPPLPLQAAVIGAGPDSPLRHHDGWQEQRNWRLRPSMGDSVFY